MRCREGAPKARQLTRISNLGALQELKRQAEDDAHAMRAQLASASYVLACSASEIEELKVR